MADTEPRITPERLLECAENVRQYSKLRQFNHDGVGRILIAAAAEIERLEEDLLDMTMQRDNAHADRRTMFDDITRFIEDIKRLTRELAVRDRALKLGIAAFSGCGLEQVAEDVAEFIGQARSELDKEAADET